MRFTIDGMSIGLSAKTPLRIDDARGVTLRVAKGRVWVTQEGCVDDVFLDAGCGHRFRRDGRVVVSVEGGADASATVRFDGALSIQGARTLPELIRRWWGRRPAVAGPGAAMGCP